MTTLVLTSGPEAGRVIRHFTTSQEAEEVLANIANEDSVLTETAWAGQSVALRES